MTAKFQKSSIVVGIFLIIFILLAIFVPKETPEQIAIRLAELRRSAYDEAVECSNTKNPSLSFQQINWIIVPDNKLVFNTTEGTVILHGWFSPTDSTIYIAQPYKETYWILLHESLHAIGYLGHPDHPFKTCNALPEQN